MSRSGPHDPSADTPSNASPPGRGGGTTGNPAVSGAGTGMGAGRGTGSGLPEGVQSGTINQAAQGGSARAGDPSLGSGMTVPERGDYMGNAATGGTRGSEAAPPDLEPDARPARAPGRSGADGAGR